MNLNVLYLSYDGILEPLGQSQVLAYLEHLSAERTVHLISYEKPTDLVDTGAFECIADRCTRTGIHWHPRVYHKRLSLLATAWDICVGLVSGVWLAWRYGLRIVHARSYVASVMALAIKHMTGARFVFDMRGFWVDERVDGGIWPAGGHLYRMAKWFERQFLLHADHVVSLTHAGVREMKAFPYLQSKFPAVSVIPTCADLSRFIPKPIKRTGFVLGYVGSAGTWYEFDATVLCFVELLRLRPDARILIVNRGEHSYILDRLKHGGVPMDAVELRSATHTEIPGLMAQMSASVFFIRPVFSKQASAPTKLGEFLGCGIPCLVNSGVGDMGEIVTENNVGVVLHDFLPESMRNGLMNIIELARSDEIASRCVETAHRYFSLAEGVRRYSSIYASLAEQ